MPRVSREYLVLLGIHSFFFLNFSELILLPKYFLTIGFGPSVIGLLMGSFSVSVLISLPAAGLLSERLPRKALFMAGTVLLAVPTLFYETFSGCLGALFLLRILQGVGFASTFGITGAMVVETGVPSERKLLFGILTVTALRNEARVHPLDAAAAAYRASGWPGLGPTNDVWINAFLGNARRLGARLHFLGAQGNATFSANHAYAPRHYLDAGRPAAAPMMGEICGSTPEARVLRLKISP